MGTIHDLEDLRPVVCEIPRTSEDPQVHERAEPPPGPGAGPPESDRHELDERLLAGRSVREMDLDRGRHEGQIFPFRGVLHIAQDRPQALQPCHGGRMER